MEFKRCFWEQDEHIYGGISSTNLPITLISCPIQWNALPTGERVAKAVQYGSQIHPQYKDEFLSDVAVA